MGRARGNMLVSDQLKEKAANAYHASNASYLKYIASWVYLFDYLARFVRIFYLSRCRGVTVLCDRYYFDVQLMERYSRTAYAMLGLFAPKPDVLAVLDCDVETLMRRKAERSPEEYARQRQFYQGIAANARVRLWRGVLDTDALDSTSLQQIISSLIYRASHRGYDY
jgi:thymidylate kinase